MGDMARASSLLLLDPDMAATPITRAYMVFAEDAKLALESPLTLASFSFLLTRSSRFSTEGSAGSGVLGEVIHDVRDDLEVLLPRRPLARRPNPNTPILLLFRAGASCPESSSEVPRPVPEVRLARWRARPSMEVLRFLGLGSGFAACGGGGAPTALAAWACSAASLASLFTSTASRASLSSLRCSRILHPRSIACTAAMCARDTGASKASGSSALMHVTSISPCPGIRCTCRLACSVGVVARTIAVFLLPCADALRSYPRRLALKLPMERADRLGPSTPRSMLCCLR
mmetsp:Transcript_17459/g.33379  ORF Transcript_17459/g.33379 Transcript_17459/m.33379 type:complete len:288 (-) Transcript_17459:3450-4313(-)